MPPGESLAQVLSVAELRKAYSGTVAVDGISFGVGTNEIVGLLGPNGAGKTTTINMVLGVLQPDAGTIHVEGMDIATHRSQSESLGPLDACLDLVASFRKKGSRAPMPEQIWFSRGRRVLDFVQPVADFDVLPVPTR